MAEVAISALGLAGLFNNVIDWFEYLYIAKNFGKRFQTSLLRLDNARLRLSRWGDAVGLSGGVDDMTISHSNTISEAEKLQAERTLRAILENFEEAKKISLRLGENQNDPGLDEIELARRLDPTTRFLHEKMRNVSVRRKNLTLLLKKAKFAIYDERHLTELIGKISTLTDDLFKLVPPDEDKQDRLCKMEMEEFTENLRVLAAAARGQDEPLTKAIERMLDQTNTLSFLNERSVIQTQGQQLGGQNTQYIGADVLKN